MHTSERTKHSLLRLLCSVGDLSMLIENEAEAPGPPPAGSLNQPYHQAIYQFCVQMTRQLSSRR